MEKKEELPPLKFNSIEEKCNYYITEYETYKLKFISLSEEYERVLDNNKKLFENINKERKEKKELEEKIKYTNLSSSSNKKEEILDEFTILEKDIDLKEDELFNLKYENNYKNNKIIKIIKTNNFSILSNNNKNIILNIIEENDIKKENSKILNINNNDDKKENNIKSELNEEILIEDFISYDKETISLAKSIYSKESKIDKIFLFFIKFLKSLKILKKGASFFNKSIILFTKDISIHNNDMKKIIKIWPFLQEYISMLQKSFSIINIYCSSLITTIDSSCIIQINDMIEKNIKILNNKRINLKVKKAEFCFYQNEFFNNKSWEQTKDKYYKEYQNYELAKYDYFSYINKFLMLIKFKLPEIMSLLIYSYIVYFTTVKEELSQINNIVRINLEKFISYSSLKNKIENDIITKKKNIPQIIKSYDKTKKEKEGFLYIKEKDGTKFSKRYVKIKKGNLIYYKRKKSKEKQNFENLDNKIYINMIDSVDITNSYIISKLLFSNVKKSDNLYPFCFEVNTANTKMTYIFQAETEYDMEEWISTISNAISEQISGFNEGKNNNEDLNLIEVNNIDDNNQKNLVIYVDISDEALLNEKYKNLIQSLIENNVCADCGAENPTWLDINWLVLLCVDCSGIHRSLSVQISKIKSLELDNVNIDYIEILFMIKQKDINAILEEKLIKEEKPQFNSKHEFKEKFINLKYKEKKYMNIQINTENEIIKNIFENIKKNNLANIYRLIKVNPIDINAIYNYEDEETGFIHYSIKGGNLFLIKFLYIIGADLNLKDKRGFRPIDFVNIDEQKQLYEYLKEKSK